MCLRKATSTASLQQAQRGKVSEIILCNYTYTVTLDIIHIPLLVIIHGSCVERDLGLCLSEIWPQT